MPVKVTVRLEGEERLVRAVQALPRIFQAELQEALMKRGDDITEQLRRRVPRDTGELADSAEVRREGANAVRAGYTAKYAPFVYYRRPRFRARTVRQTLAKYRRSVGFRRLVNDAAKEAAEKTARRLDRQTS